MTPVQYYKEYKGEVPFEMGGQKYVYCWGVYPGGKKDIAVYSYSNDIAYDYNDFRAAHNLSEGYKQPKMFMDINEVNVDSIETNPITTEDFQEDPTIGELISQSREDVGSETDALIAQHDAEQAGVEAVAGQYDINEIGFDQDGNPQGFNDAGEIEYYGTDDAGVKYYQDQNGKTYTMVDNKYVPYDGLTESIAPEAKEFMAPEKVQTVSGDNGLAGKVETGDGESFPAAKEIASLLDRMKELTKIMTNKPDVQWEDRGEGLTDAPKEVAPDEVVRSEKTTGAPTIKSENPGLRPDTPAQSTTKTDSTVDNKSDSSDNSESKDDDKAEKKENPFAKKDTDTEKKKDDEDKETVDESVDDAIEEITTHHIGASRRNVAGNDPELNENVEPISEDVVGLTDDEILESESTELMYEAMIKYKNDPAKFMLFKRKMDEINQGKRLNEAITKMRKRF